MTVELHGSSSLEQIQLMIQEQELAFWKFVGSRVWNNYGQLTNLASFSRLEIGEVLLPPVLLRADQMPPSKQRQAWVGLMIAEKKQQLVILYR